MRHLKLMGISLAALVALAACDNVQTPGRTADTPAAPATTPATPGEPTTPPIADTQITDPLAPTETVGTTPSDAPISDAAVASLASLNAVRCGLAVDAAPTPTVARVAGATELEEQTVGVAAVNAAAASLAAFPGIVKIEPRIQEAGGIASGHCGATRIAKNWLITAAHCVDEPYQEIRVIGEAENLRSPAAKVTGASMAICHAGYAGTINSYANDIALLRLTDAQVAALGNVPIARYGSTTRTLAPANYAAADMAGWGLTTSGGQLSADLLKANLKVTGSGPAIIFVASQSGAGPCIGDSGGPLYVTEADGSKTVVGVLSVVEQNRATGKFCDGDYGGRYTNLQGFTGWITEIMTLCDRGDEACR
jgi:secreted trypsin-like serine protease